PLRLFPPPQLASRSRAAGIARMVFNETTEKLSLVAASDPLEQHHCGVAVALQLPVLVEHEGDSSTHARGEIPAGAAEHNHCAAGHVFACMIADPLDYCGCATVADGEARTPHTR